MSKSKWGWDHLPHWDKVYGTVSFTWHDINNILDVIANKPEWKQERCETFLAQHEEKLYKVMLNAGWEFLKSNLNEKEKL